MSNKEAENNVKEFLRELAKGIAEDQRVLVVYAEEATVQTDAETKKRKNDGFWPRVHRIDLDYIRGESNGYVCISSAIKTENHLTGKVRYWRSEQNFGAGMAFFVDDIGTGQGSKGDKMSLDEWLAKAPEVPPTAIVETSPNNYQCWYFFNKPVEKMDEFKIFLHNFVANVLENAGGDVTIKDVTRIGRMPYGINNKRHSDGSLKYLGDDGKPFRVRLHSANYSHRYTMDDIANAFKFDRTISAASIRRELEREEEERRAALLEMAIKEGNQDYIAMEKERERLRKMEEETNGVWLSAAIGILDEMRMGEGSDGRVVENRSGKYRIQCPWGDEHTNGDPFGAYFRARIPGAEFNYVFGCAHDGCRKENKRTWATFTDYVVMDKIETNLAMVNEIWSSEAECEAMPGVFAFTAPVPCRKIYVAFSDENNHRD